MFRNYFKSAYRILLRNKSFSIINIFGLAIGMAASLLIFQYVSFEFSYDQFHKEAQNIYRIQHDRYVDGELQYQKAQSFIPLGEAMTFEYPEVVDYTTLFKISDQSDIVITAVANSGKKLMFPETEVYHVKGNFFNIFNFPIIEGDVNKVSIGKGEVLIAESTAKKYFGDQSAINQSLSHPYFGDFKVVAVYEDIPDNSHIKLDFMFGWESVTSEKRGGDQSNWYWDGFYNYIRLIEGTDIHHLQSKFPDLVDKYMGNRQNLNLDPVFSLQSLTSIHLHSNLLSEAGKNGSIRSVSILFTLGIIILFIAWANYVHLSTVKVIDRAKEVGIRKSIGSTRSDLVKQFLFESLMVNFLALLLALSFTQLIAGVYFEINGQEIPYNQSGLWGFSFSYLVLIILGSLLSGIYPAFILSSLRPSSILKLNTVIISKGSTGYLKKTMVVFQFTISIGLISAAMIIFKQVSFMQEKELGIDINQTLVIRTLNVFGSPESDSLFNERLDILKKQLSSYPTIEGFATSADVPGKEHLIAIPGIRNISKKDQRTHLYYSRVDKNFIPLFKARLVAGRDFSHQPSSESGSIIINMEGLKALGLDTPDEAIGAKVYRGDNQEGGHEIIGVVDFRANSFKEQNYPIAYQTFFGPTKYLLVKMNTTGKDQLEENIGSIREHWENLFPDTPFDYFFLDEMFGQQYKSELQFSNLLNMFTGLSIFVACLGLYGLSLFMIRQKTKEIGIRKILGASIRSLVGLLTKNLIFLIFISGLIALPLTRIFSNLWLNNYPYKTEIPWWIFIAPIFGVIAVALFTISGQILKAAFTNPVKRLRDE